MNTFTLLNLVLNPEKAGESDLEALQELIQEYPYFQAAHVLVAKVTGNSEHIKRAAAYTSDREVLMQVINSDFNADVNLPNIDNLEIGQDDLSIFDKLEKEDDVSLEKDTDFNDSFGDFDFEDAEEPTTDETVEEIPLVLDVELPIEEEDSELAETKELEVDDDLEEEVPEIVIDDLDDTVDTEEIKETETEGEAEIEESKEEELPEVDLTAFEEETDFVEEEEETDLMDELAELRKLQAEMEKNRKEAEEAMQEEEEREREEETPDFSEPTYEYPEYDLPDTVDEPIHEEKEAIDEEDNEFTVAEEESTEPTKEEEAEAAPETVPSDDFSFFDKEEKKDEEPEQPEAEKAEELVEEEESIEDVLGIEEEEEHLPKSKIDSGIFNFDDDSLFDLDALLAEESQQIDAVKELESRPAVTTTKTGSSTVDELHEKQSTLINDFIEKSPSIKIPKDAFDRTVQDDQDLTSEHLDIPSNLASENLATIYVKQGKYEKARNIYQQLILKYPQKKAYFADLISKLEDK